MDTLESDDREGLVREYLDTLLSQDWETMDLYERSSFLNGDELTTGKKGVYRRESICVMEIWCECFGKDRANLGRRDSNDIMSILARIENWTLLDAKCKIPLYGS